MDKLTKTTNKFCTACGKSIKVDTKFCPYCGKSNKINDIDTSSDLNIVDETSPPLEVPPAPSKHEFYSTIGFVEVILISSGSKDPNTFITIENDQLEILKKRKLFLMNLSPHNYTFNLGDIKSLEFKKSLNPFTVSLGILMTLMFIKSGRIANFAALFALFIWGFFRKKIIFHLNNGDKLTFEVLKTDFIPSLFNDIVKHNPNIQLINLP